MYEFHVVGDPEKYRLPHAAIIDAWELNDDGFRIDTLDVPVPRLFPHGAIPLNLQISLFLSVRQQRYGGL